MTDLRAAINDPEARDQAMRTLRELIDRIILKPAAKGRGVEIEVQGRLNALVALATGREIPQGPITLERVKGIEPSS